MDSIGIYLTQLTFPHMFKVIFHSRRVIVHAEYFTCQHVSTQLWATGSFMNFEHCFIGFFCIDTP